MKMIELFRRHAVTAIK